MAGNHLRHLPVSLFLKASKREKQIQALEHAVNYLVASAHMVGILVALVLSAYYQPSLQVVNT